MYSWVANDETNFANIHIPRISKKREKGEKEKMASFILRKAEPRDVSDIMRLIKVREMLKSNIFNKRTIVKCDWITVISINQLCFKFENWICVSLFAFKELAKFEEMEEKVVLTEKGSLTLFIYVHTFTRIFQKLFQSSSYIKMK